MEFFGKLPLAPVCITLAVAFWLATTGDLHAGKIVEDRQRTVAGETIQSEPPETPQQITDSYRAQVLLGTTLGIFWHEFGHALIGETRLPATGPEEDVADGFSAFMLSAAVEESRFAPEEQEFMAGVVKYSALLWYYVAAQRREAGQEQPWQDEHAPDLKRFRNAFCIVYGSNPARHADLAAQVGLSERTRRQCLSAHAKRYRAWEAILTTVSRKLGPGSPGAYPPDTPGGKILVDFQRPASPAGQTVVRLLRDTGIMSHMMTEMEQMVVWPRDLKVVFRECGRANAWYDAKAGQIAMCYGLIERLTALIFQAEGRTWNG